MAAVLPLAVILLPGSCLRIETLALPPGRPYRQTDNGNLRAAVVVDADAAGGWIQLRFQPGARPTLPASSRAPGRAWPRQRRLIAPAGAPYRGPGRWHAPYPRRQRGPADGYGGPARRCLMVCATWLQRCCHAVDAIGDWPQACKHGRAARSVRPGAPISRCTAAGTHADCSTSRSLLACTGCGIGLEAAWTGMAAGLSRLLASNLALGHCSCM